MVLLLRCSKSRFGSSSPFSTLKDLSYLLQHHTRVTEMHDREAIVLRDIVFMIGMMITSSSSALPDSDVEEATGA